MPQSLPKHSPTRSASPSALSKPSPAARLFLQGLLPPNWARLFQARPSGKYFGLMIACPKCGQRPPKELVYASRKWRWLSVHIAGHGK